LEVIKFICKEFWVEVFKKHIDKLQTNHRGMFVLNDMNFRWLSLYASDDIASKETAHRLLHFPCGMIRGALANLGFASMVRASLHVCIILRDFALANMLAGECRVQQPALVLLQH
jgi:hypothetical protein